MRDAAQADALNFNLGANGQADIGIMREELGTIAIGLHLAPEIVETLQLLRGPRQFYPLRELGSDIEALRFYQPIANSNSQLSARR